MSASLTQGQLATGVLVLPMRQTVLVAKQAAEIDALSAGRLRLGIGVGHVEREFDALGMEWRHRGHRVDEQIEVLRALWTGESVSFAGRWHQLADGAGLLAPRAVQRPIPVWTGGTSEPALRRAARVADGWMTVLLAPDDRARALIGEFHARVQQAGRNPRQVGLNAFLPLRSVAQSDWESVASAWRAMRITHLTVEFEQAGLRSADAHIDALERVGSVLASIG